MIFNGADTDAEVKLPRGNWTVIARDGELCHTGLTNASGAPLTLPGGRTAGPHRSALILAR